jgi:hypothetical protein
MTALAIAPVRQHDGMSQREFITALHAAQQARMTCRRPSLEKIQEAVPAPNPARSTGGMANKV